jgi:hypothetical protein
MKQLPCTILGVGEAGYTKQKNYLPSKMLPSRDYIICLFFYTLAEKHRDKDKNFLTCHPGPDTLSFYEFPSKLPEYPTLPCHSTCHTVRMLA